MDKILVAFSPMIVAYTLQVDGILAEICIVIKRYDMNQHVITSLSLAIVVAVVASCQPHPQDEQNASTAPKNTVMSQNIKPAESGYADVNGLKMYYEVYGKGKPIVLLHGSFMNIPLNWSHIIPLLAKDRKVIVPEMQGHGRTRDIPREFSYEGMADDVSGLLKHLKIDSADILGYSMGGGVAFQVGRASPSAGTQARDIVRYL
ncbi:MAG: alpha/beta hydrolase [Segetibacter sp.]